MSDFKSYLIEKNKKLLDEIVTIQTNARFSYDESDLISDMIKFYISDRHVDPNIIHEVLEATCITFESLKYKNDNESNHEDLVEIGYILGILHSSHAGKIYGITFERIRYYYIGVENDIATILRNKISKTLKR